MIRIQPFDDSQHHDHRRAAQNQHTSTLEIDAYRQGVELTLTAHYTKGMVKIHAGYNGQSGLHTITQLAYGQSQKALLEETYFCDVVPTQPAQRVMNEAANSDVVINKGVDLDVHVDVFDGVIEPFHIRDVVALRRKFKAVERKIWAALGEGNIKNREGSDVIASVVKHDDVNVGSFAMNDMVDHYGNLVTVGGSGSVDNKVRGPFKEDYPKKGVISSINMESDMEVAVSVMSPGTANMLPDDYIQLGASGFDY